jgi:hypothetical protein
VQRDSQHLIHESLHWILRDNRSGHARRMASFSPVSTVSKQAATAGYRDNAHESGCESADFA